MSEGPEVGPRGVREGIEDETYRKEVQAAVDAGKPPPPHPLPPGTPPDLPGTGA